MTAETPSATDAFLRQIVRRLILRSFPRLRHIQLTISWGSEDELLWYTTQGGDHRIGVNECLKRATTRVLEGGIAHELCHIDADARLGRYQRELAWDRYGASRWMRMREERATDARVLDLGYGPHLLAFVRFARSLGYSFAREHGLLSYEIRRAIEARANSQTSVRTARRRQPAIAAR